MLIPISEDISDNAIISKVINENEIEILDPEEEEIEIPQDCP